MNPQDRLVEVVAWVVAGILIPVFISMVWPEVIWK